MVGSVNPPSSTGGTVNPSRSTNKKSKLYTSSQIRTSFIIDYEYEEGRIIRAAECDITAEGELITARTVAHTVRYYYDGEGNLTKKVITPAIGEAQTVYYETADDKTVVKFTAGGNTVTSHSKTYSFGRKVFDELQLGFSPHLKEFFEIPPSAEFFYLAKYPIYSFRILGIPF